MTIGLVKKGDFVLSAGVTNKGNPLGLLGWYREAKIKNIPIDLGIRAGGVYDKTTGQVNPYFGVGGKFSF